MMGTKGYHRTTNSIIMPERRDHAPWGPRSTKTRAQSIHSIVELKTKATCLDTASGEGF